MAPALSPEADRIIYTRVEANAARPWISAVAGGTPIPLTNDTAVRAAEYGSPHYTFSADGKPVYGTRADGDRNLLFWVDIASGAEKIIGDLA